MNEAETRAEHIDPALRAAGWGVVEGSRVRREYPITLGRLEGGGRRGKPLTADYVLEYRNTRLAVVEAKAWDCPLTEGVAQAKNYAGKLAVRFTYATNGRGVYGIDMQEGREAATGAATRPDPACAEPMRFPSPEELWRATFATVPCVWRERFAAVPFEDKGGSHPGRYYQDIAVERVLAAVGEGRKRVLLTLATGTGKTFIAFQIAWKLFHARWNLASASSATGMGDRHPRILFLADRNILADQAYNAFSAFEEDALVRIAPDAIRKKGRVPTNGSLFFTIFQTFMASTGSATESDPEQSRGVVPEQSRGVVPEQSRGVVPERVERAATGAERELVEGPDSELREVSLAELVEAYGYMYILECVDGSFYVGSTRELRLRLEQHQKGEGARHTAARLPVKLVYYETFDRIDEAFAREKQVQGWSRAKKLALIEGRNAALPPLAASVGSARRLAPERSRGAATTLASDPVTEPVEVFGAYPPDFFDFIVIDECHRGGANDESEWRAILEYFAPAVQLGLTATPKRDINGDTYAYFGEPVYIYSLKEGINDGYLTPFRVRQITTSLDEYVYTPGDIVVTGEVDEGRRYTEPEFNRTIVIDEREKKRVALFMGMIDPREKALVFCATQEHALAVRDYINQLKTSKDANYCHRVTADDGELGEQHLRDFQDNEKSSPLILTTSRKLSTGVDARNVRAIVLLRPVHSIVEFKQIIGRGTRLYDGKDYFTIYDFVKAHQHFSDPEWDGEPLAPEPPPPPRGPGGEEEPRRGPIEPPPPPERLQIKLADGKARTIQHMAVTTFWHPDGTPMSAQQFLEMLFGQLPEFFHDEAELRRLWSAPDTRARLLDGLAEKGFGRAQLREMQRIIDAENSDLFDVLAHVAYALPPLSREIRAAKAKVAISTHFNSRQQVFLDFVLSHYVDEGVDELEQAKLSQLLRLRYHDSIADAVADLGRPDEIGHAFAGFQRYLYSTDVA